MIKLFLMDIDGVLTDGKIIVSSTGEEYKTFCFKDFDAFSELKTRGIVVGAITGENTPITEYIKKRVPWDYFYSGIKNKFAIIKEICKKEQVLFSEVGYIGDGKYDLTPLSYVGLAVCPKDAIPEAKEVAHVCLSRNGGEGCIWELINVIDKFNAKSRLQCMD